MPKRPVNMVKRKNRPGYYFRKKQGGRTIWIALGPDYVEACRRLRSLKTDPLDSRPELTLEAVAKEWLKTYVSTARNPKGVRLAQRRVERYLVPHMGHLLVRRLTSDDLRRYRLALERNRALSLQTVAHLLSDCRCMVGWAVDAGFTDRNPVPRRLLPRIQERPPDRVTDAEAEQLREMPEPYGFVARLGLGTGLRWGELARARRDDVEGTMLLVHQTKTSRVRRVPLDPELQTEIRHRLGKLIPYAESAPGAFARMAMRLTGIEHFHPHQMRHTFACQWLERGGSLAALQQILGHSTIVTTQRYARLTDEGVMAEAARLAQAEGGKG